MATMRDVALRAGVSLSTVSFVVNDTKPVSAATRGRVEHAMLELGFRRNVLARALASRETRILAVVVPALEHPLSRTALEVVTSAAAEAVNRGFHLVLLPMSNDVTQLDDFVAGGLVDGLLLMEVQSDDPRVERLEKLGVPFLVVGRTADPSRYPWVDMDFDATVREGLGHLHSLGHRNVPLVIGQISDGRLPGYGPLVRTEQAYLSAMAEFGETPLVIPCAQDPAAGRRAASEVFERSPGTTAVMVMNEEAAFGVAHGIQRSGRRIPDDVSVLSLVTSLRAAGIAEPTLTALLAPSTDLGRLAVGGLIDQIKGNGDGVRQATVACTLEIAGSTGPASTQQPSRDTQRRATSA